MQALPPTEACRPAGKHPWAGSVQRLAAPKAPQQGEPATLIKSADDKAKRLKLLEKLQASAVLDTRQREWLKDEYWRVKKGIDGERDAAFHIDSLLRDGENHAVIHDLRIKVDADVAQIDHLVISRAGHFLLIETKCFGGNVQINEAGEFTVAYDSGKRFGVPSPMAQSQRHERVLSKLLERLEIGARFGSELRFHHVVMLHPKAIIQRPDAKRYDTRHVIKADQFAEWRERHVDAETSGLAVFGLAMNFRSSATVRKWGEKIARQHRPDDLLALPDFMRPKAPAVLRAPSPVSGPARAEPPRSPISVATPAAEPAAKRLICANCGVKISFAEGKFCWNNPKRFGGLQYCREHQATQSPAQRNTHVAHAC